MNVRAAELKSLLGGAVRRTTLAVAESLTGGRLQAYITEQSGASEFFLGGMTAYSLEQKTKLLGVEAVHAAEVHGVSARVAGEMAVGACRLFGADLAVATTGYAEPAVARGVQVPLAWIAIARHGTVVRCWRIECPGATRTEAQAQVAEAALTGLIELLRG
ncbi:MAG: CinA family protein [Verrucomicrobia bacterium]|nr:CinA family protein [Verrucomicrobiota bacterium]